VGTTDSINIIPVPGAIKYQWETNSFQINSILFDATISPVSVTGTSIDITYTLPQLYWEACVTAISACCTSAASCVLIPSVALLYFSPGNNPVALPNSSGTYGVEVLCSPGPMGIIQWFVTGDITFNNGTQNLTTGSSVLNVPLNFGPNFTSGTLCAYTINSYGMTSDTICMTINAPVGLADGSQVDWNYYYNAVNNHLVIEFVNHQPQEFEIYVYDMQGKLVLSKSSTGLTETILDMQRLAKSVYNFQVKTGNTILTGRFSKLE